MNVEVPPQRRPDFQQLFNASLHIDITFRYIRYKGYIVLNYWPTNMS